MLSEANNLVRFLGLLMKTIQRGLGTLFVFIGLSYLLQPQSSAANFWSQTTHIENADMLYAIVLIFLGIFILFIQVNTILESFLVAVPLWVHSSTIFYYVLNGGTIVTLFVYFFINIVIYFHIMYYVILHNTGYGTTTYERLQKLLDSVAAFSHLYVQKKLIEMYREDD